MEYIEKSLVSSSFTSKSNTAFRFPFPPILLKHKRTGSKGNMSNGNPISRLWIRRKLFPLSWGVATALSNGLYDSMHIRPHLRTASCRNKIVHIDWGLNGWLRWWLGADCRSWCIKSLCCGIVKRVRLCLRDGIRIIEKFGFGFFVLEIVKHPNFFIHYMNSFHHT